MVYKLASTFGGGSLQFFWINLTVVFVTCDVFCGEDFDDGASKICSRVRKYCGGAMRSFFKEVTSFFNHLISSSKFSFVIFRFSSTAFGVEDIYVVLSTIFSQLILKILLQCYGIFLTSRNLNCIKIKTHLNPVMTQHNRKPSAL